MMKKPIQKDSAMLSDITVIVRAHNEEQNIERCLELLLMQDYPSRFYTIVVDNASTDDTRGRVGEFLYEHPEFNGGLIEVGPKCRGFALHKGVEFADTDIVVSLDADSYTEQSDWLLRLVTPFVIDPNIVATTGRIKLFGGPPHHSWVYDIIRSGVYSISSKISRGWLSLANCAFRKQAFLEVDGTRKLSSEGPDDKVLAIRLRKLGAIDYVNDALVLSKNWLDKKKDWGSQLYKELNWVQEKVGAKKSLFHIVVEYSISPTLLRWDRLKKLVKEQALKIHAYSHI